MLFQNGSRKQKDTLIAEMITVVRMRRQRLRIRTMSRAIQLWPQQGEVTGQNKNLTDFDNNIHVLLSYMQLCHKWSCLLIKNHMFC